MLQTKCSQAFSSDPTFHTSCSATRKSARQHMNNFLENCDITSMGDYPKVYDFKGQHVTQCVTCNMQVQVWVCYLFWIWGGTQTCLKLGVWDPKFQTHYIRNSSILMHLLKKKHISLLKTTINDKTPAYCQPHSMKKFQLPFYFAEA